MTVTLRERKLAVASAPWIAYHKGTELDRCRFLRGAAPLKVYRHPDEEVRRATYEKYRCKNTAHWVCVTLDGRLEIVCWPHLAVIICSMEEDERWQAWAKIHWPFPRPNGVEE